MGRVSRQSTEATKAFADRLGELISAAKSSGMSHEEISKGAGVASGAMSDWASDNKTASIDSLYRVATYFGVSTDWLLGLSDYVQDSSKPITLYELGFSEKAANQIASIAGAAETAADLGNQANEKVSSVENPCEYTLQEEARAFLALNVLLQSPEFVRVLGNAWSYMRFTGRFDRNWKITLNVDGAKEPFSAPCDVLLDALWNRVAEPLRNILSAVAHEVQQGTRNIDIPKQKE